MLKRERFYFLALFAYHFCAGARFERETSRAFFVAFSIGCHLCRCNKKEDLLDFEKLSAKRKATLFVALDNWCGAVIAFTFRQTQSQPHTQTKSMPCLTQREAGE